MSFKLPDNYFAIGLALPHDIVDRVSRDMTGEDEAGECGKTEHHLETATGRRVCGRARESVKRGIGS